MIVYRVENAHGEGPYNDDEAALFEMAVAHNNNPTRPNVFDDIGRYVDRMFRCGFETLEQLDQWFHGWKGKLAQSGYGIATYEVDEAQVVRGTFQLAFDRSLARRTGEVPMYAKERRAAA